MAQQATTLIKFRLCDFDAHYDAAQAAYESDPKTAWIAPFTLAQRLYWGAQDGGLINGYAEEYAVEYDNAIEQAAQSAYNACIGASTSGVQPSEPVFRLAVSTRLDGGVSGTAPSTSRGLSTQLNLSFAPVDEPQQHPLDWRAFYRVGDIQISYNYADNWLLSFPPGGGYTEPSYTTLPMRPSVQVQADNLVALAANYVQYIDVPEGQSLSVPDSLVADFSAVQSHFSFTIQRRVVLPDGQIIQEEVNYDDGFNNGELSDVSATVYFPALSATCDVSGTVDVYHFITAYSFGTLFKLANNIQQVRGDGVVYDFTVPADAFGTVPPSYGPPGLLSIHEAFYYSAPSMFNLGIVRVKYYGSGGVFQYQRMFFVWAGMPANLSNYAELQVVVESPGFYIWETDGTVTSVGNTSNTVETVLIRPRVGAYFENAQQYSIPIIEDVVVNNAGSWNMSVSSSAYISYTDNAVIKVHGTLKLRPPTTYYWGFVEPQPSYTGTEKLLSVVPDFIDYVNMVDKIGIVRVKYYGLGGELLRVELFLTWVDLPLTMPWFDHITFVSGADKVTDSDFTLRLYKVGGAGITRTASVIEEAVCTIRRQDLLPNALYVGSIGAYHYYRDPANLDYLGQEVYYNPYFVYHPGYPGYPEHPIPSELYYTPPVDAPRGFLDFTVTSTGNHVVPYTFSTPIGSFTMANITGVIAYRRVDALSQHIHFYNPALTSLPSTTNANSYEFLEVVDDFMRAPKMVVPYASPVETWPSL